MSVTKPTTVYSTPAKPITAFAAAAKPTTAYSVASKPTTPYTRNPSLADGVKLSSLTVRLSSLTVHLHGYTTDTPPAADRRPTTSYSSATKPTTAYQ